MGKTMGIKIAEDRLKQIIVELKETHATIAKAHDDILRLENEALIITWQLTSWEETA